MIWLLALTVALTTAFGTYLALSRDGLKCVVGLSIVAAAVNLVLFTAGRLNVNLPPIIPPDADALGLSANPLPQALVLTAIVIGLALICFAMILLLGVVRRTGTDDIIHVREAEPVPLEPGKPNLSGPLVPLDEQGEGR